MLVIGLTGGIASGKTAVSDAFARHGVPIVDTDLLARELVRPGQPALAEIAGALGPECIDGQGGLDRGRVRRMVFERPELRRRLEAILHPRIREAVRARVSMLRAPYCIVVIPLLAETGMTDVVDRVLVVDLPEAQQVERVMARDGIGEPQARQILTAQASRAQRLALADDVIRNDGDREALEPLVARLHRAYVDRAGGASLP